MKIPDAVALFDELEAIHVDGIGEGIGILAHQGTLDRDTIDAADWLLRAEGAIKSVLPATHPVCARWNAIVGGPIADRGLLATGVYKSSAEELTAARTVRTARGVFRAARTILKNGQLGSLIKGVRAETVVELAVSPRRSPGCSAARTSASGSRT